MKEQLKQKYCELLGSLKNYLLQEYPKGSWLPTDANSYSYFLNMANRVPLTASNKKSNLKVQLDEKPKFQPTSPVSNSAASKKVSENAEPLPSPINKNSIPSSPIPTKESPKPEPISKAFKREITTPLNTQEFSEIRAFFQTKMPGVQLVNQILDDKEAKDVALRWQAPPAEICILSFNELPKEQAFLSNLSLAINRCLASAQVLSASKTEQEKGWEKLLKSSNLKLVIASNYNLHTLPELIKLYREDATGKHTLGDKPLYLLSDLSLYMQQPHLKATLWKALCQYK